MTRLIQSPSRTRNSTNLSCTDCELLAISCYIVHYITTLTLSSSLYQANLSLGVKGDILWFQQGPLR